MLHQAKVVTKADVIDELEISLATFKRDLSYLRDRMNIPVEFDKNAGGYRIASGAHNSQQELPGIWFNADEIHALLTMQQLLSDLQPELLSPHIKPIIDRLSKILDSPDNMEDDIRKRIKLQRINARKLALKSFKPVSSALLQRLQLQIEYFHKVRNKVEHRVISPQRLVYYRDNWYLEAWCHLREDMRSFALDSIQHASVLKAPSHEVSDEQLEQPQSAGYGIFRGQVQTWATLRFSPHKALWVSKECWHPNQISDFDSDGNYILQIPYTDDRELIMDILRHVPEVTVMAPAALKQRVIEQLEKGLAAMKKEKYV